MYEQKHNTNSDIKLFGFKIYEQVEDVITIFDHEFQDNEESQTALAESVNITRKFLGIPILKVHSGFDHDNLLPKEETVSKFKLPPINKMWKIILITIVALLIALSIFTAGIYTANTPWFNDTFYITSRQMENLEIKSLKPHNKALYKDAYSQADMNLASRARYEHYHEYYNRVVSRIKNLDFSEEDKSPLISYIDKYNDRKAVVEAILFPNKDEITKNGEYGTIIGSLYPSAMLEFDRQELLMYRMLLRNMYSAYFYENNSNYLFEE